MPGPPTWPTRAAHRRGRPGALFLAGQRALLARRTLAVARQGTTEEVAFVVPSYSNLPQLAEDMMPTDASAHQQPKAIERGTALAIYQEALLIRWVNRGIKQRRG